MTPPKPTYDKLEARLTRAEALIAALKGAEVDAVLGQDDIAFIRDRHIEEQNRKFQAELERRVAERTDQLRKLALELTQAEQRERQRLAEILHDHVQQLVAGAKLRLDTVRADLHQPGTMDHLEKVYDLLNQAIKASRSLSRELCPPDLYANGLMNALDWLGRNMQDMHGLNVRLHYEAPIEPDSEAIRILAFQSVRELLFNVVKHGDTFEAIIDADLKDPDMFRITVSDNGSGFDPDTVSSPEEATGFGLFSIKERIEALGGHFRINSQAGKGTRIDLFAPLYTHSPTKKPQQRIAASPRASSTNAASDAPPPAANGNQCIRLMIADDHQLFREGLVTMFHTQPDIQIVGEAKDGQEAIDLAKACQPDVVIMDISMPKLNGIEATRIITSELPNVYIIGLSMHSDDQRGVEIREAGAMEYLTKDAPLHNLVDTIRKRQ